MLTLLLWIVLTVLGIGKIAGLLGMLLVLLPGTGTFVYYRHVSVREFGGITGDLAGWFLQLFEAAALACLAAGSRYLLL